MLPNLQTLDLRRNPLPISPEILGLGEPYEPPGAVDDIFNYLRQLRSGDVRPLNEAKMLLVGQGSVGKTSLIERLVYDRFNSNQEQTDGLAVNDWSIFVNGKDVRLNVWDFGGQEIYHATHQFFLTKRSLYLLVVNCRTSEEENRIEYWLKLIQSFGDAAPVILVGNKCDEQPLDLNRRALREKYPNIQAIIETSCADSTGIEDLRTAIHTEIGKLREVYDLLPLSWFQLKEELEAMDKDFISYTAYTNRCCKQGITEERDQHQLITLLHNLGLVLNFREHPLLQSTNVLNPHWVTDGIYALLSDDTLKTQTKGIITSADLSRILDSDRYPVDRHRYLTDLMQEFELCFPLRDQPSPRFLIPGLLPKEEPENVRLSGDTLEFRYHYTILPNTVFSRFIVQMHEKIHEQTYWRTGVLLEYCEGSEVYNTALVRSDPIDHKIFITITGRETTRRSFLSLIRDTFTRIHKSFGNLEVSEWVPVPNHPDAPPLDYQELMGLEEMGDTHVAIGKLKLRLDLRQLLDGYEPLESRQQRRAESGEYGRTYEDMVDITKRAVSRPIYNHAEVHSMSDDSKIVNNLQRANIANFANKMSDNAQQTASQFTQTSGANTTELLELVDKLRQTASQFPPELQEDLIIDIDDVETELQKPDDQRNPAKLRKRLLALATAVSVAATPIATTTDFMNNLTDIGSKIGIEIPQLP